MRPCIGWKASLSESQATTDLLDVNGGMRHEWEWGKNALGLKSRSHVHAWLKLGPSCIHF